ncbi:fructoselysine 3-epimerase [Planctomycetes bacterium MalM25]|nr:fructoselysine 3-epimerase [Planctomycetes bacterium MalM25]
MTLLSINEQTTYQWSFEEDLLHARDAGYDGLGVWLRKLSDFGEERAIELIEESGLGVSSLSWVGGFTGADAASAAENIAAARDAIALAGELRAGCLVMYTGGRNGHTLRHSDRLLRTALDALTPHAEEHGVPLALEPMHPACSREWTFLTDLPETLRLIRQYESPGLKLSLDTFHFPLSQADDALVRELVPHLAVVHVGDYVEPRGVDQARVPLGRGEAPLGSTLELLREAGYEGYYDVKLLGPEIEATDYHELLRRSRRALEDLLTPRPTSTPTENACKATW